MEHVQAGSSVTPCTTREVSAYCLCCCVCVHCKPYIADLNDSNSFFNTLPARTFRVTLTVLQARQEPPHPSTLPRPSQIHIIAARSPLLAPPHMPAFPTQPTFGGHPPRHTQRLRKQTRTKQTRSGKTTNLRNHRHVSRRTTITSSDHAPPHRNTENTKITGHQNTILENHGSTGETRPHLPRKHRGDHYCYYYGYSPLP